MLRYHNWGKYIQEKGYKVTIVAASTVHNTDIDVIEKCDGSTEQYVDGVRYLYVPTPRYSGNGLKRIKNMLSYCLGIRKYKKHLDQPDCIVICEAYLLPFVRQLYKKTPIICDIVDLWPLSIIEYTSVSESNPLIKLLYRIEQYAYVHSDALIFSMQGGLDYIRERKYAKKVNPAKVFHINMGCDLAEFDKNSSYNTAMKTSGTSFIVTYCGSIRQANHVIQICEAAKILKENGYDRIQIRFFGNGSDEDEAKSYCRQNGLNNVEFFGRFEKARIPVILSESDANIMTYKQTRVMKYGGSQSKLFDYLASGKPIINCGDWGYNLISLYNSGIVVKEQTGNNIAVAIQSLYEMPCELLEQLGKRARMVAEEYDQPVIVDWLLSVLNYVENKEASKYERKNK